jgi:hypothetical protein
MGIIHRKVLFNSHYSKKEYTNKMGTNEDPPPKARPRNSPEPTTWRRCMRGGWPGLAELGVWPNSYRPSCHRPSHVVTCCNVEAVAYVLQRNPWTSTTFPICINRRPSSQIHNTHQLGNPHYHFIVVAFTFFLLVLEQGKATLES